VLEAGWGLTETSLSPLGSGHINDTLLATGADGRRHVLQRINERVFVDPELVMDNLVRIQNHLEGQGVNLTPPLIKTRAGTSSWCDPEGGWWRLWRYVADSRSFNRTRDPALCHAAALTFGRFQAALSDLPGPLLTPTIPGFLELAGYLDQLDAVLAASPDGERSVADACGGAFIDDHRYLASVLPKRTDVIHGDCKLNNLLFARDRAEVVAVLDLDTVMTGHWAWDFGDLVRSVLMGLLEDAGPGLNDEAVHLFDALARGYIEGSARAADRETLAIAPVYVTFMLGVRFLTDHLEGDRYFKVSGPGENLERARVQFDLARLIPADAFAAIR